RGKPSPSLPRPPSPLSATPHESPRHAHPPFPADGDEPDRALVHARERHREDSGKGRAPSEESLRGSARPVLPLRAGDPSGARGRSPHSQGSHGGEPAPRPEAELSPD